MLPNQQQIAELFKQASVSERLRSHLELHKCHNEKVQRVLIALQKGSYVEPHYHDQPHQWEMFVVMQGALELKLWSSEGEILGASIIGEGGDTSMMELQPGQIHSVECISEQALMLEIKEGPFDPANAKVFPKFSVYHMFSA